MHELSEKTSKYYCYEIFEQFSDLWLTPLTGGFTMILIYEDNRGYQSGGRFDTAGVSTSTRRPVTTWSNCPNLFPPEASKGDSKKDRARIYSFSIGKAIM